MKLYLDTSAYVKEYHDDLGSEIVHSIFENAKNGSVLITISLWTISETLNTIDRHFMRHELNEAEYSKVLGAIFSDIYELLENHNLQIVDIDIDTNLVKMSWEYISSEHLSAADSLHLVTALKSNVERFYAADKILRWKNDVEVKKAAQHKPMHPFWRGTHVGEKIPDEVEVNGKSIKLHELIWRCIHKKELFKSANQVSL